MTEYKKINGVDVPIDKTIYPNIAYPNMKVPGIDPLLTTEYDTTDLFKKVVNGKISDNGKSFKKLTLEDRLKEKYDYNKNQKIPYDNVKSMMKHYNYSKSLCKTILRGKNDNQYEISPLPYYYENNDINKMDEFLNIIDHDMVNYNKETIEKYFKVNIPTNEEDLKDLKQNCNDFYKTYCELINSDLKEAYKNNFDTDNLGKYENMCTCYQDLYKDYLSDKEYKNLQVFNADDKKIENISGEIAGKSTKELLNNGGLMISQNCYVNNTQLNDSNKSNNMTSDNYFYAPSKWNNQGAVNISVCQNTLDANTVQAINQGKISVNQGNVCSAGLNNEITDNPTSETPTQQTTTSTTSNNTTPSNNTTSDKTTSTNNTQSDKTTSSNNTPSNNSTSQSNTPNENIKQVEEKLQEKNNTESKDKNDNTLLYLGVGGGLSLCCCITVILILFFVLKKKK